jgi:transposase
MDEFPPPRSSEAESTHKSGHKGAPTSRIEVISRGERRRTWTPEQKREIVAESLGPDLTPTEVARKHAISSGQLYTWRQQVIGRQMTVLARTRPDFAQVEMTPAPQSAGVPDDQSDAGAAPLRSPGLIEIVLPSGVMVRITAPVDAAALRLVLRALGPP